MLCAFCIVCSQAAAGNPEDPENQKSSWFSNPGQSATAAPVRSGVGKYIAAPALDAPLAAAAAANGAAAAAAAAPAQQPAAKKQKVAPAMNFDAW